MPRESPTELDLDEELVARCIEAAVACRVCADACQRVLDALAVQLADQ